jgi:hypothetical protein
MSRYISKLPEPIRELAEKRRSEQCIETISDYLAARFEWRKTKEGHDFWQEIENNNYSVFYTLYPQKDKLDEVISEIEKAINMWKNTDLEMDGLHTLETILNKAKEIKCK